MKDVFAIYKLPGETPLEALDRIRAIIPKMREEKLSYAGRLDPLAEGVMLVLAGEANKDRKTYLDYDKTYYFDVLFGIKSDSFDPLGKVEKGRAPPNDPSKILQDMTLKWKGERTQAYPPYSSKTVHGRPLFLWAREGASVSLPERPIFIYEFKLIQILEVPVSTVVRVAKDKIKKVKGDFRQSEAVKGWSTVEKGFPKGALLPLARFNIKASSGTYVRSLADSMGDKCGSSALAFNIVRTNVGPFGFEHLLF